MRLVVPDRAWSERTRRTRMRAMAVFHLPLAIGIADAARQRDDAIVGEPMVLRGLNVSCRGRAGGRKAALPRALILTTPAGPISSFCDGIIEGDSVRRGRCGILLRRVQRR